MVGVPKVPLFPYFSTQCQPCMVHGWWIWGAHPRFSLTRHCGGHRCGHERRWGFLPLWCWMQRCSKMWTIPIDTIFSGMNIHLPAILGFTRYQGFDPSPCSKMWTILYLFWKWSTMGSTVEYQFFSDMWWMKSVGISGISEPVSGVICLDHVSFRILQSNLKENPCSSMFIHFHPFVSLVACSLSSYLSINQSIYLSINQSIYISIYLSINLSIYQSIYQSIYLSINLSIYQSIYLSIHASIHLSIYPCIHPFIHPSIHPSTHPFIHPSIHLINLSNVIYLIYLTYLSNLPNLANISILSIWFI